jgi:hypothetical protein
MGGVATTPEDTHVTRAEVADLGKAPTDATACGLKPGATRRNSVGGLEKPRSFLAVIPYVYLMPFVMEDIIAVVYPAYVAKGVFTVRVLGTGNPPLASVNVIV